MPRDRLQGLAGGAHHQRQGDQRHHRGGHEKGTPQHGVTFGGKREEAEELLLEDEQPEDREHDRGGAGHHLDARLHHSRQTGRASVLGEPDRGGHP